MSKEKTPHANEEPKVEPVLFNTELVDNASVPVLNKSGLFSENDAVVVAII